MLILLDVMLRRIVRRGNLTFFDANGLSHRYGDGAGPPLVVRVRERRVEWHLVLDPQLALGESYMRGALSMERGRIYDLLELFLSGTDAQPLPVWARGLDVVRYLIRRAAQFNPRDGRGAMWRTTTTSMAPSTTSFSTATGSILAPISRPVPIWKRPSWPKSATWRPSSPSSRNSDCWISARVGADLVSIWPRRRAAR